jgi:hypothetical protein
MPKWLPAGRLLRGRLKLVGLPSLRNDKASLERAKQVARLSAAAMRNKHTHLGYRSADPVYARSDELTASRTACRNAVKLGDEQLSQSK